MSTKNEKHTSIYFIGGSILILVTIVILLVNNSYGKKEKNYLARIPDRVSSEQLAKELNQLKSRVQYFGSSENTIKEYPEHFNRHFTLIPYKESFGTNISYVPARSCLIFKSNPNYNDWLSIVNDLNNQVFDGSYILDSEAVAKGLDKTDSAPYIISMDNRKLRIRSASLKYKIPAQVCLLK